MDHPPVSTDPQLKVPEDNQQGHHPDHDQDKPDPDKFVARFESAGHSDAGGQGNQAGSGPSRTVWIVAAVAVTAAVVGAGAWWRMRRRR